MKKINEKITAILLKMGENKITYFYMILSFFVCFLTLKQLRWQIAESIRFIIYVSLFYSVMKLQKNVIKVYSMFSKPWHKILLLLLEAYATFATVGMYILDSSAEYSVDYAAIAYLVMSYIWVRPIVITVLAFLVSGINSDAGDREQKFAFMTRLILIGIIIAPCIIFLIGFNPAITSYDSDYCLGMAHTIWEKGVSMLDWHPPFYIFVLSVMIRMCDSVTFIVMIQIICFAVVFVDGILYFYSKGISRRLLAMVYCFIAFGTSNIIQLITLWKDIPYGISLLWLTLLLIKYVMDQEIYENKWGWYIQTVFALIFTALFRQNGILPALVVLVLMPIMSKASKKMLAAGAVSVLLLVLVKGPLYNAMEVEEAPQLKFFSLANDIMYSYYQGDSMSKDAMEIVNKVTNNDPDHYNYSPQYVYYNGAEPSGYTIFEFLKIYVNNAIHNPRDAVMAVLIRNSNIWSIVKPIDEKHETTNYIEEYNEDAAQWYPFRRTYLLTTKLTELCNWSANNHIINILYWRIGIYNVLMIFLLGILLTITKGRRRLFYIIPFIPIAMNTLALLVSSGWNDYRYFWPSMLIGLFLLCYFMVIKDTLIISDETACSDMPTGICANSMISIMGVALLIYCIPVIYDACLQDRNGDLRSKDKIDDYIQSLNYDRYETIIEVRDASFLEIPRYKSLFLGLGVGMDEQVQDGCFLVIGQGNSDILTDFNSDGDIVKSVIGELCFRADQEDKGLSDDIEAYQVYLDGVECYHVTSEENTEIGEDPYSQTDLRIWVRDCKTGERIDYVTFSYKIEDGILATMRADHFN